MAKRHPICNHTLAAARRKQAAFRIEAETMLRNGVTKKTLDRLALAGARIFTDLDPEDMAEIHERRVSALNFSQYIRR